jgi:phage terminase large subunit-like protein
MSEEDFAAKIQWEGGVVEALDYGLKATDLKDPDTELGRTWAALDAQWTLMHPLADKADALVDTILEAMDAEL